MKNLLLSFVAFILCCTCKSQNVGIGTVSPAEKLEVNGGVRVGYTITNNSGTFRYNNGEIEYNNGFGWRTLVNSFKDSSLSSLTPFVSATRNSWVEVPDVSMTVNEQGVYLIIYKANGYNNSVYFPGSGNADNSGSVDFRLKWWQRSYQEFYFKG